MSALTDEIKAVIEAAIEGSKAFVSDPMNDQTHLEAIVVSESFVSLTLLKQHKLVMQALKSQFDTQLHALKLTTLTPKQWTERS